jgi:hypothetical protein
LISDSVGIRKICLFKPPIVITRNHAEKENKKALKMVNPREILGNQARKS